MSAVAAAGERRPDERKLHHPRDDEARRNGTGKDPEQHGRKSDQQILDGVGGEEPGARRTQCLSTTAS